SFESSAPRRNLSSLRGFSCEQLRRVGLSSCQRPWLDAEEAAAVSLRAAAPCCIQTRVSRRLLRERQPAQPRPSDLSQRTQPISHSKELAASDAKNPRA